MPTPPPSGRRLAAQPADAHEIWPANFKVPVEEEVED